MNKITIIKKRENVAWGVITQNFEWACYRNPKDGPHLTNFYSVICPQEFLNTLTWSRYRETGIDVKGSWLYAWILREYLVYEKYLKSQKIS